MARNNTQNQNIDPAEYDNMLGNIKRIIGIKNEETQNNNNYSVGNAF